MSQGFTVTRKSVVVGIVSATLSASSGAAAAATVTTFDVSGASATYTTRIAKNCTARCVPRL